VTNQLIFGNKRFVAVERGDAEAGSPTGFAQASAGHHVERQPYGGWDMTYEPTGRDARIETDDLSDRDDQRECSPEEDILTEVADALVKIRELAQGYRDKMLLYCIDMAICQACECLCSELRGTAQKPPAPVSVDARMDS
jgi:hypothetical protein